MKAQRLVVSSHTVREGLGQTNCPYVGQLSLEAFQRQAVLNQGLALGEEGVFVRVLKVRQLESLEVLVRFEAGLAVELLVFGRLALQGVLGQLLLALAARQQDQRRRRRCRLRHARSKARESDKAANSELGEAVQQKTCKVCESKTTAFS